MSIGETIINEIVKQGMFTVSYPDPDESHVFVWSSGSVEQLEAVVEAHVAELRELAEHTKAVIDERDEALAEAEELRRDKARMDWMEEHKDCVGNTSKGWGSTWFAYTSNGDGPIWAGDSLRGAIDAAFDSSREHEQPGEGEQ